MNEIYGEDRAATAECRVRCQWQVIAPGLHRYVTSLGNGDQKR
jgi:hypothetical protein